MSKKGSCLCGDVNFTYKSDPKMFVMCHCTDCQKSTGSAVASIIIIPEKDFDIKGVTGSFECEAKVTRSFCKNCGSQIFSRIASAPGIVAIKTGVLNEQPEIKPNIACWTKSKPEWLEINHPKNSYEKNPG